MDEVLRALKKSEERLTKSLNDWLFNFFGEWELRDLNWLYEINDIENGAELCGNRCHGERFSFTFRNTDVYSEIILSFTDLHCLCIFLRVGCVTQLCGQVGRMDLGGLGREGEVEERWR